MREGEWVNSNQSLEKKMEIKRETKGSARGEGAYLLGDLKNYRNGEDAVERTVIFGSRKIGRNNIQDSGDAFNDIREEGRGDKGQLDEVRKCGDKNWNQNRNGNEDQLRGRRNVTVQRRKNKE